MNKPIRALLLSLALPTVAIANNSHLIENQYIVSLDPLAVDSLSQTTDELLGQLPGSELLFQYDRVLLGFAARLAPLQAELLRLNPLVRYVEQDQRVYAVATQTNATWGIDRIDQAALPLNQTYEYVDGAGSGAHVYVIDSGINPEHQEFAGRLGQSRNFVSSGLLFGSTDPENWQDCNGHGTHVASTAAGSQWGVAKHATIHAVRVLDCVGTGSGSGIIAAMEWVAENAERPAVANLSLGTLSGRSTAQEEAARGMYDAGVLPVVAAGNDSKDACTTSPAAEPSALTTASSDSADSQSSFSNHGVCVDLFAPGSNITAADYNNNSGSQTMSGTSMATPHVAGVAAVLLSRTPSLSPAELSQSLVDTATPNALSKVSANTPNLLLYSSSDGSVPTPTDRAPQARFSFSCDERDCVFDASTSSDDFGIASYEWDLGDGNFANGRQISHRYAADGDYSVSLVVTDTAAQSSTQTQTVSATSQQSCGLFGCGGGWLGF